MPWFPAALAVAFFSATEAALLKRFFGHQRPLVMAATPLVYLWPPLALAWLAMCLTGNAPDTPASFWYVTAVLVPLNSLAMVLHLAAVGMSPLSVTMPYQAFTPVFVIGTANLLLDETVTPAGLVGILLIVGGSYVLNFSHFRKDDLLAPFKAIMREPGSRMMLAAALLYAWCAVLGKRIVLDSDPLYATVVFWGLTAPFTLLTLRLMGRIRFVELFHRPALGALTALVMGAHYGSHMYAVTLTATANMIAVKRLNGLFSVFYGRVLFGEGDMFNRAAGSLTMAAGAIILSIWG